MLTLDQRAVEIPQDIFNIFEANRKADQVRSDAAGELVFFGKLLVGCAGGMDNQTACISDVCEMGEKLNVVDDRLACFVAAFDAKGKDGTRSTR